jgi:hypothetical protein
MGKSPQLSDISLQNRAFHFGEAQAVRVAGIDCELAAPTCDERSGCHLIVKAEHGADACDEGIGSRGPDGPEVGGLGLEDAEGDAVEGGANDAVFQRRWRGVHAWRRWEVSVCYWRIRHGVGGWRIRLWHDRGRSCDVGRGKAACGDWDCVCGQ